MATPTASQLAVATLYSAVFNRAPDATGFDFWMQAFERGASLSTLARGFLASPEGQAAYPSGMTSTQFVSAFYATVFGRPADAGGLQFWSAALDALGGAGNPDAQAALMGSIIQVASTPITTRPPGIGDEAYAQTVADRARFLNKAEVAVYFAAELRSNDLSLAKQVLAGVTADPASVGAARALADQAINPTPPVVVVPPAAAPVLTNADDVAAITNKLAAYAGAAATADTSGMDTAQLKAVAAGLSKFKADGLTGALALTAGVTAAEATALLGKYAGTTASANATGMDAAYLAVLAGASSKFAAASITAPTLTVGHASLVDGVTESLLALSTGAKVVAADATAAELLSIVNHIGNVADGGITGTFALVGTLTASQLTVLLGKLHADARVTADVSAMLADQLAALAAKPLALEPGALTGALHLAAPLSGTDVNVLLNRYAGADATLVATGAGSDVLNATAATLGKVSGISGDLALLSDVSAAYGLILLGKYTGSTATVDASVYTSAQLQGLSGNLAKFALVTKPSLTLSDSWLTSLVLDAFLFKSSNAQVDTSLATDDQLTALFNRVANVADDGITGALAVPGGVAAETLATLFQKTSVAATVNVNAGAMNGDQVVVLFQQAAKIDSVGNLSIPSGTMARLPADLGPLLQKGLNIKMDLTGASTAQLKSVAANVGHIDINGWTGTYSLDNTLSMAQIDLLLGTRASIDADVTVQASGMTMDQLVSVVQGIAKVDKILGLSLDSSLLVSTGGSTVLTRGQFASLLSKAEGAKVDVTSLGADRVTDLLQSLDHVADAGLSGTLALGSAMWKDADHTKLDAKLSSSVVTNVIGVPGPDIIDFTGFGKKVYVDGRGDADLITLGSGASTVFIGGRGESRAAGFNAVQTSSAYLDRITIKDGDVIKLSQVSGAFGIGLTFSAQTPLPATPYSIDATGLSLDFQKVFDLITSNGLNASTNEAVSWKLVTVSSDGVNGKFLVINDADPTFGMNDTIIELLGSFSTVTVVV